MLLVKTLLLLTHTFNFRPDPDYFRLLNYFVQLNKIQLSRLSPDGGPFYSGISWTGQTSWRRMVVLILIRNMGDSGLKGAGAQKLLFLCTCVETLRARELGFIWTRYSKFSVASSNI